MLFAAACVVGLVAFGVPVKVLAGDPAGDVVLTFWLAAGMFCIAGGVNTSWRMFWYGCRAQRLKNTRRGHSEKYARLMRRSLPRNSSLVFQFAVAIMTVVLAV